MTKIEEHKAWGHRQRIPETGGGTACKLSIEGEIKCIPLEESG